MIDPELERRLASSRFRLNHVYKRKAIAALADRFVETDKVCFALVKAHAAGWNDVAFEFDRVSGSKFRCYGVGRADRCPVFKDEK